MVLCNTVDIHILAPMSIVTSVMKNDVGTALIFKLTSI